MSNVVQPQDSWSNFASNPASFLEKLRKSGEPMLLNVEGQGEVVVQDAAAFRRDQKQLDRLETIAAIKEALLDDVEGRSQPFEQAMEDIARKLNLPPPQRE